MLLLEGHNANDIWRQAAEMFLCHSDNRLHPTRRRDTQEFLHVALSIADPRQRWTTVRKPPINPAFAIAETIWIMNGRNDASFLTFWNQELIKHIGSGPFYHGAYGYRLRCHFGIDQLVRAYESLSHDPDTRQIVLQIWDSHIDFPDERGKAADSDIPCNVLALLKLQDGALDWMQIIRSNDLFLGLPYNLVQFTTLQEILAGWLGVKVGTYNQISDSLHLYDRHVGIVAIDTDVPYTQNNDSLALPKDKSDYVMQMMQQYIERLIGDDITGTDTTILLRSSNIPSAYYNQLCILAAESSRRHKRLDVIPDIVSKCTNPILKLAWNRWYNHISKKDEID